MRTTAISTLALLLCIAGLNARTWPVPSGTCPTIQAGLDSARANDTVLVAPGVYQETLNWPSRASIKLLGELGPDTTVIDVNSVRRVVNMPQYLGQTTVIDGFTIRGGWATPPAQDGAAFYCSNTAPLIRGNRIVGNQASGSGGAVYTTGGTGGPHVVGNVIEGNSANIGGGCAWYQCAGGVIRENFFYQNSANRGGAVDCQDRSHPEIRRNRFQGNRDPSGCIRCGWGSSLHWSRPETHWNNLDGNGSYEIGSDNEWEGPVPATSNWYGTDSAAARIRGEVTYDPWLHGPLIFDIAAESVAGPPDTVFADSTYVPKVVVRNRGHCDHFPDPDTVEVTFFTATCAIGDYRKYVRVERTVRQDSCVVVTFPTWTAPADSGVECTMKVWLHYAPDMDSTNDTLLKRVVVSPYVGIKDRPATRVLHFSFECRPAVVRDRAELSYSLPEPGYGRLEILDVSGEAIRTVVAGTLHAGSSRLRWDGAGQKGAAVPPGVYFARLQTGRFTATRKMVKTE